MSEKTTYFHGVYPGLSAGDEILPPILTGAPSCSEYGGAAVHRRDRVYITVSPEAALIYAAMHPSNHGKVYAVNPFGTIEPDPDCKMPKFSFQCEKAIVMAVVKVRPQVLAKTRQWLIEDHRRTQTLPSLGARRLRSGRSPPGN